MPPVKKKKKTKAKHVEEQEDTESSESGKLSETHEVAQHLSRTRLDKENTCTPSKSKCLIQKRDGDPYDADSEPETGVLTSMIVDQNIPLERQLQQSGLLSLRGEHSTPNLQPNRGLYSSCYGFDELASPLQFSPVGEPMMASQYVPGSPGSVSLTSSVTSISPAKRKADLRVFDVPIEKPSKKMKKRKTTKILDTEDEDWVAEIKSQFEEVEMLDLVVD
ncbi:uncharacterized protein LOC110057654 [Orbicella faveolata]|uniref:uncharacterized protein LOC110057654 n=1 Tax=Orbicella faveolata TaxID=48498 RepID=UPI0009E391EF|nr:uncharacterized protein LOC110057654 [Orbicella faveolata]